jgi:hypothetical protein
MVFIGRQSALTTAWCGLSFVDRLTGFAVRSRRPELARAAAPR